MDVHSQPPFHIPPPGEHQYSPHHHHQQQHQHQWPSRLLPPASSQPSSFSSPATPSTSLADGGFNPNFYQPPTGHGAVPDGIDRASLSLNLSSLSVASPTSLSPIAHSPHTSTATSGVSPITPISPSNHPGTHQNFSHTHFHPSHQNQFSFAPPDQGIRYDDSQQYEINARRMTLSSRSSSSSDKSIPRKRSFNGLPTLSTNVEESMFDDPNSVMDLGQHNYDEVDMSYPPMDSNGSPADGNSSNGDQEDSQKPLDSQVTPSTSQGQSVQTNSGTAKPLGTNNFVTKLYQMINDPKSAHFIAWTELGTSFVVSNVGEFSRSILGSHFKHNNFSSFVRQLNMYGFHKINRTPRAQRTSTDAQTWEFSHHKFLRGRPDLLEEIKRKALEPDPSIKHRVELPGELAAQLNQMRDENRRVSNSLAVEKAKVDKLVHVTKALYDLVAKTFPGGVPIPFPSDLIDPGESPNIYITSPTMSMPPQPFSHAASIHSLSNTSLHSMSPSSSPTTGEFPSHVHAAHTLSRQPSFQHPYDPTRFDSSLSNPLPPSPSSMGGPTAMDFDDLQGRKRQRIVPGAASNDTKRLSRARSDSAPLGYAIGSTWGTTRPRSGSGLAPRPPVRREDIVVPNIGSVARAANANAKASGQPLIPIAPAMKQSP